MGRHGLRGVLITTLLFAAGPQRPGGMPFLAGQEGSPRETPARAEGPGDPLPAGAQARLSMPDAAPVFSVAFAPDGRTLATSGYDAAVRLWDVRTGREVRQLLGHDGRRVRCV